MTALVAPSLVLIVLVNAYPFIYAAIISLRNGTLISSGSFVGLSNFRAVVSDSSFWQAAEFTLIYTIVGVFGSWALGMALALLLQTDVPGAALFRLLLLLPWIVPFVVSANSWNWLVTDTGGSPVLALGRALGFGNILWLADPNLARVTVMAFKVWAAFPFMMVMLGAALEGIDKSLYEAAKTDGATAWQRFVHVTLPLTAPTSYIIWILMAIYSVNDFAVIYLLTGGGPNGATTNLGILVYQLVFENFQAGYGVAAALLMTVAMSGVAALLYRRIRAIGH